MYYSICLFFIFFFCLKVFECENDIFNIALDSTKLILKPEDQSCNQVGIEQGTISSSSLFGFSISIDETENSLFIGAPNCNQVYKCPNFENCNGIRNSIKALPGHLSQTGANGIPNKDWFGASVLARGGKTFICAPRQLKNQLNESQLKDELSNTGACYSIQNQRKFSLHNKISYPDHPHPIDRRVAKKKTHFCKRGQDCGFIYVDIMEHAGGVLGNNVIFGRNDSLIVGLPYAWMGSDIEVIKKSFSNDYGKGKWEGGRYRERMIGTIGKINLVSQQPNERVKLVVPHPHEHTEVAKEGGAIWGGIFNEPRRPEERGTSQYSTESNPVKNFYTGTSITKGNFFTKRNGNDAVDYAVGSPNGDSRRNYGGIVYLCPNCFKEETDFGSLPTNYELILHGQQFAERFGQAIISIDLDGDKYDDLVVGAPLHSTKTHNYKTLEIGTIYVFKNRHSVLNNVMTFDLKAVARHTNLNKNSMNKELRFLERKEATSGSRFGMSLINLGRFDGDKYEDFAVGSPGADNGLGAIYIYRGSKSFWTDDKDQQDVEIKLTPKTLKINQPVKCLGYSFSNDAQKLSNGRFTRFAVGAVSTDDIIDNSAVILMESRPTIEIIPSSQRTSDNNIANDEGVHLEFIAKATTLTNVDPDTMNSLNLKVSIEQTEEGLIDFNQTFSSLEKLAWNFIVPKVDENLFKENIPIDIKIKKDKVADPAKVKFKFSWSTALIPCNDKESKNCPMKDPRSNWEETLEQSIWVGAGCVDIKNCKCKLQLSSKNDSQELIIGKDKSLNVSFILANVGEEPSLESKIEFIFPIHLKLIDSPEYGCSINGQRDYDMPTETQDVQAGKSFRYECELNGKLNNKTSKNIDIQLKLSNRLYELNEGTFSSPLYPEDSCNTPTDNQQNQSKVRFILKTIYDIKVGINPDDKNQRSIADSKFAHQYNVWNSGPSITNETYSFIVGLPKHHVSNTDDFVFGPTSRMVCSKIDGISAEECPNDGLNMNSSDFIHYKCKVEKGWSPDYEYELKINMNFTTHNVPRIKKGNSSKLPDKFYLPSFIKLPDNNECVIQTTIFSSSFTGDTEANTPIWPIILGLCIGVIIFAVSIFLMWKYQIFDKFRFFDEIPDDQHFLQQHGLEEQQLN